MQHVDEALGAAHASVSLNQTVGADDEGELGDLFADREAADPFEEAEESLRRQGVRRALDALPERERRILELRFGFEGEPWTLEAIGHELDLTRERVRQLEGQALARLGALRDLIPRRSGVVAGERSSRARRIASRRSGADAQLRRRPAQERVDEDEARRGRALPESPCNSLLLSRTCLLAAASPASTLERRAAAGREQSARPPTPAAGHEDGPHVGTGFAGRDEDAALEPPHAVKAPQLAANPLQRCDPVA